MNKLTTLFYLLLFSTLSLRAAELVEREIAVMATPDGYYPDRLVVYQGEKVRFYFTALTRSSCLLIEDGQLFLSAEVDQLAMSEVVFKRAGRFKFYCPEEKKSGYLHVLRDHTLPSMRNSENNLWIPR